MLGLCSEHHLQQCRLLRPPVAQLISGEFQKLTGLSGLEVFERSVVDHPSQPMQSPQRCRCTVRQWFCGGSAARLRMLPFTSNHAASGRIGRQQHCPGAERDGLAVAVKPVNQ